MSTENEILDSKLCKRHFPRTNNSSILEFVFEKDPNLFLRKHKIIIKGYIEVSEDYIVENGWVAKLFSQLNIEVDSQSVSISRNR